MLKHVHNIGNVGSVFEKMKKKSIIVHKKHAQLPIMLHDGKFLHALIIRPRYVKLFVSNMHRRVTIYVADDIMNKAALTRFR